MRILVDTNVFLDYYLQREPFFKDVQTFFHMCKERELWIYVTTTSLRDIGYVVARITHSVEKGKIIQSHTYASCKSIIGNSGDNAINALYSDISDYEDALIVEAAKDNLVDFIVTNNTKDFANAKFPIYSPSEIIKIWKKSPRVIIE